MMQLELSLGPSYQELFAKHKALREHIQLAIDNIENDRCPSGQVVLILALRNDVGLYEPFEKL